MTTWGELLGRLAEVPRENGTAALHQTAIFLQKALESAGVKAELVAFTAEPYGLRLAGVFALVGGLLYARQLREGRHAAALVLALLLPGLLLAQLDFRVPVFAWIGAQTQHHVRARLPIENPRQRLLLTAHYDTKTDVLDHVARAPVDAAAVPMTVLMLLGPLAGWLSSRGGRRLWPRVWPWVCRTAAIGAAVYGLALFVVLSAGAFLPDRSPGALDNGGSCAVLVRLAEALKAMPPLERTEIEILLLSAEEVGVQGSHAFAAEFFSDPPALPTHVLNLEGLGASSRHAVFPRERFSLRSIPVDPGLLALLDAVHGEQFSEPLEITPYGAATDARSFLARGIPAATLITRAPGSFFTRGLHSASDDRSRLDEDALEASLAYLLAVVSAADERGF